MGSMLGSILSATALTALPEMLREFNDYRMVVYSLVLILVMMFKPSGLLGTYDFSLNRWLETLAALGEKETTLTALFAETRLAQFVQRRKAMKKEGGAT